MRCENSCKVFWIIYRFESYLGLRWEMCYQLLPNKYYLFIFANLKGPVA
jgi:hypothetical protein